MLDLVHRDREGLKHAVSQQLCDQARHLAPHVFFLRLLRGGGGKNE